MKIDDQNIIATFKKNDEQGLQLLFSRYYRPLCVYALKFLDDMQVAEDLVQDIFVRFWEDKKYKSVQGSFKNYLFVSVRNRSINYLSSKKVVNTDYLETLKREFTFHQFDEDELEEKKKKLYHEIAQLPPQSQKVLRMIVFERKKYKEVAEELDVSVNTVKTHFSRALKHLRSVMDILIIVMLVQS